MKVFFIFIAIFLGANGCGIRRIQEHGYGGAFNVSPTKGKIKLDTVLKPILDSAVVKKVPQSPNLIKNSTPLRKILGNAVEKAKVLLVPKFLQPRNVVFPISMSTGFKPMKEEKDPGDWAWVGSVLEGFLGAVLILAAIGLFIYGIWGYAVLLPILSSASGVGFMHWFLFAFNSTIYADIAMEIALYLFGSLLLFIAGMAMTGASDSIALWILIGFNFLLLVHMWPQFLVFIVALIVCLLIGAIGGY